MTPSIWCVFIVCNRIKNKCKEAYLYVTTVSNRFQNYLDPDCSSRTRVATDMKLFPDSDEIENRILTLAPFAIGTQKLIQFWHKHDSKKLLHLKFLKHLSGILWCYNRMFFLRFNSFNSFWFQHLHDFFWKLVAISFHTI